MNVQIVKKTTMNEEKYLEERLAKHNPFHGLRKDILTVLLSR